MGTQEVIVGDPEGKVIAGTVDVVKAAGGPVRKFIGAVEPFDHLLEGTEFPGDGIVVGKPNNLCDLEGKVFPELLSEFHGGKGICTVTVSDEPEVLRQLCETAESHAHGEDAGADATVARDLVADDGAGNGVHDEPDVSLDAADLDIGFVSGKHAALFVGVVVNKGLDADGSGLTVVGDLLVGDADVIEVFERLGSFP